MKRFFTLFIIFFISLLVYGQDTKDFKINKKWIEVKRRSRTYFQKREMLEFDKQTVDILENSSITEDVETEVADLLNEIIVYDALDAKETSIRSLILLEKKFKNKTHFFRIAADFSANYAGQYPVLLSQILIGMKNLIKSNYEEDIKTLQKIYEHIKQMYVIGYRDGTPKYRNDTVLKYLREYITEFDRLLKAKEIEQDTPFEQVIIQIKNDFEKYKLFER